MWYFCWGAGNIQWYFYAVQRKIGQLTWKIPIYILDTIQCAFLWVVLLRMGTSIFHLKSWCHGLSIFGLGRVPEKIRNVQVQVLLEEITGERIGGYNIWNITDVSFCVIVLVHASYLGFLWVSVCSQTKQLHIKMAQRISFWLGIQSILYKSIS